MFTNPVLFGQRDGRALEWLGEYSPYLRIVGVDTDAAGIGVDTLSQESPPYDEHDLLTFGMILAALRRAYKTSDANLLGLAATASSRVMQRHGENNVVAAMIEHYRDLGAVGVQVSHSGTIAGFIFDRLVTPEERYEVAGSYLARLAGAPTRAFDYGGVGHP